MTVLSSLATSSLPMPTQEIPELPEGHPPLDAAPTIAPEFEGYWVHDLDSVLFNLGPIPIRYYSLSYLFGVLLGMWLVQWLANKRRISLTKVQVSDLALMYGILGIIIGGRLGWVLFYGLGRHDFSEDPLWPLKIWKGGMASHGGMVGMAVAIWLFARRFKHSFVHVLDCVALAAPIGLCLGRVANFINGELWGRPTDVSWAVIFAQDEAAGLIPRHPSQLYEAFGEGLLLFLVLFLLHRKLLPMIGATSGLFCMIYGVARIVCEQYRQEDAGLERESQLLGLTRGQQLTVVLVLVGAWMLWMAWKRKFGTWNPPDEAADAAEPKAEPAKT